MAVHKDKKGRYRYRFQFRGKRYSGSTPKLSNTKAMCERLEKQHHDKLAGGLTTEPVPYVKDFIDRFLAHQQARTKAQSHDTRAAAVRLRITPSLATKRLDEITTAMVDELATKWTKQGLAPKTVNWRLGHLRRMLSLAQEWDIIAKVPRFNLLDVPEAHPRFLSDEEARALLDAADPQWRPMMFVALRTGMRVGELRGLTWADADLDRGVVHVRRNEPGRIKYAATTPKGGRVRSIPLTPDAVSTIRSIRPHQFVPTAYVWKGRAPSRPRSEKGCSHAMDRTRRKAGLGDDIGWHTLRHTYASWLVMRGVPLRVVQEYLGHASIVHTEIYAHLSPQFGHAAVALLDVPLAKVPQLKGGGDDDE